MPPEGSEHRALPWRSKLPLFIGGFMGPFGTVIILPMFPEIREEFGVSQSAASLGFSLYLVPFALLLLVSGTLGERWGRRRTVRATYVLFGLASIACALAPTFSVFILARAAQGVANAFITPLLLAGLAETVPRERFGRQVGIYSSFQALGGGLGPVVGGLAADTSWQWAFYLSAAVAFALAFAPPAGEPRTDVEAPKLKPLLTRRMVGLGIAFFFAAAGPIGASALVSVAGRDVLHLSGSTTGIILLASAMSALACGPLWGRLLDRLGPRVFGASAVAAGVVVTALLGFGDSAWSLGIIWAFGGAAAGAIVVMYQTIGSTMMPDNRGGALSFLLSFRFMGHAVGPLVLLPFIESSTRLTFLIAAALGLITLMVIASLAATPPQSPSPSPSTGK